MPPWSRVVRTSAISSRVEPTQVRWAIASMPVSRLISADLILDAGDEVDGLTASGAAGAVGDRDVVGLKRPQGFYGAKQVFETFVRLGRKELEGDGPAAAIESVDDFHRRNPRLAPAIWDAIDLST